MRKPSTTIGVLIASAALLMASVPGPASALTAGSLPLVSHAVPAVADQPRVAAATTVVAAGSYEQDNPQIEFSGTWVTGNNSGDSGGSSVNGKAAGDYAQLSFQGSGVRWIGRTGPSLGLADVYLDGVKVATVDSYSSEQKFQQTLFTKDGLSSQQHTIRIVRLGKKSSSSKGNDIVLDLFKVVDTTAPPTPRNIVVTPDRGGFDVQWDVSAADDLAGYRVYRALGQGSFDVVSGGALLTSNSFYDLGAQDGATYRYAIMAEDTSGNRSDRSKISTVTFRDPSDPTVRLQDCPTATTTVSTLSQLRAAVAGAQPGSVIWLSPGTYTGGITVSASGTAAKPIWICGPATAVLDNRNNQSKNGVLASEVSYVNVAGFTIQNFRKGVVVSNSDHVGVSDLNIRNIGEEAIKVRYGSTDTKVTYNRIRTTGMVEPGYGEGVYIGTSPKNWCSVYDCNPDRSDRTMVIGNDIAGTTADPIEAKPGTSDGEIRRNLIDGASLTDVSTLLAIKGSGFLVVGNVAVNGKPNVGFYAAQTEVEGWGRDNLFANNSIAVPGGSTAIYVGTNIGNIVDCSNRATTSGSTLTNVSCQK